MKGRCSTSLALVLVAAFVLLAAPARAEVIRGLPKLGLSPLTLAQSANPAISANGRFVSGVQGPGGVCGSSDGVFVYDLQTSTFECVSVDDAGRSGVGVFGPTALSGDGQLVVFQGTVLGLDARCAGSEIPHIYLRNRRTRHTECVSVDDAGRPDDGFGAASAQISASGNLVVFTTSAQNLVPGDANGSYDIYGVPLANGVRSGPIERITMGIGGAGPTVGHSVQPRLSADGRFVVFTSNREDLVSDDTNAQFDVFRYDRQSGQTVRVSLSASGRQTDTFSSDAGVSADGRFVSFASYSTNLIEGVTVPFSRQIYRKDLVTGEVRLVSGAANGALANGDSSDTDISADGRIVVFLSSATNLEGLDTNGQRDVFAADLRGPGNSIRRLSVGPDGTTEHDGNIPASLLLGGPDGRYVSADAGLVVFFCNATNLTPIASTVYVARIPDLSPGLLTGPGAGGGPHVRTLQASGLSDPKREFLAYDPRFGGGVNVAYGDVTGDGVADIVTGAGPGGGPHVRVFDGAHYAIDVTGAATPVEIASFFAYDPGFAGGIWVAVGDVTGDGVADIITGAGSGGGPHVRVFRAVQSFSGSLSVGEYASFFAYQPDFTGGVRVSAGDLDGDGVAEIVTGAGPGGGPHVRAFRFGAAAEPIPVLSFFAYNASFRGGIFVAAGDVDGDGKDEIITGADAGGGPHVRVLTVGSSFSFLREAYGFFAYDPSFSGGVRVAAGDLDHNGRAEIITAPGRGGAPLVRVFRRADAGQLSELSAFFAYDPAFRGGVFVAAPH